ncbi:MAG: hypothetical protein KAU12_01855 [Candidatus Omnitrophica bacterium]|nr:hypothetical protein [Candidatus Omnitrophota bacterium]
MHRLKKFFVVTVCFWLAAGFAGAEENLKTKEGVMNVVSQSLSIRERDPFGLSEELLRRTLRGKYVSFSGEGLSSFNLPRIEITGVMIVGDKAMATAEIETLGAVTLKPQDKIVFAASNTGKKRFNSFIIKEITPDKLVILLEGGYEIHGRFR